ncbi:MAG: PP2C family protein-serine/threonine phosphatase, partial [Deinococcales bacterium]
AVLRLQRRRLTLSSAGMPPVLVLHRSSRAVDEVLLPGVPLGTLPAATYQQRDVELENGDVVVVMTDGLVEALDGQGRMFGYERTAAELAKLAGRPAAEVVGAMLDAVNGHLGGATPPDDVTLVALVVR